MKKACAHGPGFTDREMYPALLILVAGLAAVAGLWILSGRPAISSCWFYSKYHIYCPGCGCTRALIMMLRGEFLQSLYYNPAVLPVTVLISTYLVSQTLWRLLKRRGWVLHYADWWIPALLVILAVNCILRNVLWLCFRIPL